MTAAPGDADLGLNLVFSAPSATGGGAGGGTAKRKTKYDRRRERGEKAKSVKEEEKKSKRQQHTSGGGGEKRRAAKDGAKQKGVSSLAGIAAAFSGGFSNKPKPKLSAPPVAAKSVTAEIVPSADEDDKTAKLNNDVVDQSDNVEEKTTDSEKVTQLPTTKDEVEMVKSEDPKEEKVNLNIEPKPIQLSRPMETEQQQPAAESSVEDVAASSRRHRAQIAQTEEQRAEYLSEFHARPRDLDRSERASRDIKASLASDHIFGRANDDSDDEEDAEMNGKSEEQTKSKTTDNADDGGESCPFQKLGLHSNLISTLTSPTGKFKLSQPTIVQSRSIAALLPSQFKKKGKSKKNKQMKLERNLFIQSETGSGKTLAYLLPILQHLAVNAGTQSLKKVDRLLGGTRCILLLPTRELATQTYTVANTLCAKSFSWIVPGCFSGGEKRKSEKARLRKGISILIATPGRLLDHLSKTESLLTALKNRLEWIVLDEADRLLDAGLGGQVEQIVQHLRSNQPRAGPKKDGVTWRSVLVSATVTKELEGLAKTTLGGDGWMWARGHANDKKLTSQLKSSEDGDEDASSSGNNNNNELDNAAPRQLAQLYMVVSAKLRLTSLAAFLAARASKGERVVVFMSTCDSVDYHHELFTEMECILGDKDEENDASNESGTADGIFGKECPIFKLHGDIPHNKRQATMQSFNANQKSAILLATDVAARGLNFPSLDWIVQYDPPCETKDYVHRAGRSARAGAAGHALLFLLPSERQYVEVLQLRGLKAISALSLGSTLGTASTLCRGVAREGESKAGGNKFSDGSGEAFTLAVQHRMEQCVIQNDVDYKAAMKEKSKGDPKQKRSKQKRDAVGPLLEGARKAFSAFVRAYPAKEKAVRHIFNARGLHLGHMARSMALRETPKMVTKAKNSNANNNRNADEDESKEKKRKSRLAFGNKGQQDEEDQLDDGGNDDAAIDEERDRNLSLLGAAMGGDGNKMRKKAKMSSGNKGGGSGRDIQKRMMERAMMMQGQEFM